LSQGRGGAEWTTAHGDAQQSSWVRSDPKVSTASLQKGGFQYLWKMKLHNETHQLNSLTQPVFLDRLVGFRGFKSIAVVGASSDTMYAMDFDLGKPLWTYVLNYSADNEVPAPTWNCPGGLMAAATRPTALSMNNPPALGGGGRGGASGGSVGDPGKGAPNLAQVSQRGDRGRGAPQGGGGGRGRGAAVMGLTDAFYAMGSDGFVHGLNVSNGADLFSPVKFVPENSKPSSLLLVEETFNGDSAPTAMMYTSTSGGCGGAPNGVWGIALSSKEPKADVWKTDGGNVAGSGPTLGANGLVFAAIGKGQGGHSDSVVALDAKNLELKDWITVPGADFNSSPVVFAYKGRELLTVTANDGKLYLLDGKSLGGANHSTPLFVTTKFSSATESNALATWENSGTRWILAPFNGAVPAALKVSANGVTTSGGVLAFKLADANGKLELQPSWASRNMVSPLGPLVVNNVVFALSSGEYHGASAAAPQRVQRSVPAVLYALDGATGKELWNSGKQITSFARSGLAAGGTNGSIVFVTTYDNTVYTFGYPLEK
jgi:hypothetical protein